MTNIGNDKNLDKLTEKLENEERLSNICRKKIDSQWRKILREEKLHFLQKEVNILKEYSDRRVEQKENVIKILQERFEIADDQFRTAIASHFQTLDGLIDNNDIRLLKLERGFSHNVELLQNEHNSEWKIITEKHISNKTTVTDEVESIALDEKVSVEIDGQERQQAIEEVKNKNLEELNNLRFVVDSKIEDLQEQFEVAQNEYRQNTDSKVENLQRLRAKDVEISKEIGKLEHQIDHLHTATTRLKTVSHQTSLKNAERNKQLIERKNNNIMRYKDTKGKIEDLRSCQHNKLKDLTKLANKYRCNFESKIALGENIIKIAELIRKKENTDESNVQEIPIQFVHNKHSGLALIQKRHSQALLDLHNLRDTESSLQKQNCFLRDKIKKFHDGITINNDVICANNPLMVINGKIKPAKVQSTGRRRMTVVDANHAFAISHAR